MEKTKAEKAIERSIESFMVYQCEAEKRFQECEDNRWRKEVELGEKRRQEDCYYEMRIMEMLGQMFQQSNYHGYTSSIGPCDYDY